MAKKPEIKLVKLRPSRRYEVTTVTRQDDLPLVLRTRRLGWLDDLRHSSICSQYGYPFYESPDDFDPMGKEETKPTWWVWKPHETVFTLDGQGEILSTDTTLRDSKLDERELQDSQRTRLEEALSQHAIDWIERKETSKAKNDYILTILTYALLLAVCVLAIVFLPDILERASDVTGGLGGGLLPFGGE